MSKKKKNYIELRFDKDKLSRNILYVFGTVLFGSLIIKIFQFFLIPGALSLMNMLLLLWTQYQTLEGHYLFFGTVIMLFITWKIFLAFVYLFEKCFEWMIKCLIELGLVKTTPKATLAKEDKNET